jgi:hypothetical protein
MYNMTVKTELLYKGRGIATECRPNEIHIQ